MQTCSWPASNAACFAVPHIGGGTHCRWNYFLGGVGIYMGTIIMEGAAMSLESKARFSG